MDALPKKPLRSISRQTEAEMTKSYMQSLSRRPNARSLTIKDIREDKELFNQIVAWTRQGLEYATYKSFVQANTITLEDWSDDEAGTILLKASIVEKITINPGGYEDISEILSDYEPNKANFFATLIMKRELLDRQLHLLARIMQRIILTL